MGHVVKLWNSWMQNIMATRFYMCSREECQTMEDKLTKVSLHYRNYLCFKVHQVKPAVS